MPFFGHADARLDDKNRVAIPAKFRREFGDGPVYVMATEDGCIAMYTEASFEATREEVKRFSRITPEGRRAWRQFFGNTERLMPDSQGRVVIPAHILAEVNIQGPTDVVVRGLDEWLEVWSVEAYLEHRRAS
jgi:MraZ protein